MPLVTGMIAPLVLLACFLYQAALPTYLFYHNQAHFAEDGPLQTSAPSQASSFLELADMLE